MKSHSALTASVITCKPWRLQAAVIEKPEEPQGIGGFERVSYSNPLGRRSIGAQAQVSTGLSFFHVRLIS